MRRLLYVSPYFPPRADLGAKRALNLARHLPALGWDPVVLCSPARKGEEAVLGHLVPEKTEVVVGFDSAFGRALRRLAEGRGSKQATLAPLAPTAEPASNARARSQPELPAPKPRQPWLRKPELTPLDQMMWDLPEVVPRAIRLASEAKVEAVLVNADPWSGLLVGAAVKRRLGLPFVADFRDPWSLHPRKSKLRPRVIQASIERIERFVVRTADRVVLNTEHARAAYVQAYRGQVEADRFVCIRNAFDRIASPEPIERRDGPFSIHYFGTVGGGRDATPFFEGFAEFVRKAQLGPDQARCVFYGDETIASHPKVLELELSPYLETRPRFELTEGIRSLRRADLLLLLEGADRELQLPAKLYDYLSIGRPILAVGANEELRGIIERTRIGQSVHVAGAPALIADRLREFFESRYDHAQPAADELLGFTAEAQSESFADLLNAL